MVSCIGRILLVATSLAPVCGAFAVNRFAELGTGVKKDWIFWSWIGSAFLLTCLTGYFLYWCKGHLPRVTITTKAIKPTDKDILAFLLTYLLPLLGQKSLAFESPIISAYILILIFVAVFHSNAYHFNPMLAFFGYHFYEVECKDGLTAMLISKQTHLEGDASITIGRISPYLFLEVG